MYQKVSPPAISLEMSFTHDERLSRYEREEPISVGQYVRADYGNGKSEIGVVSAVDDKMATISTSNGYEVSVRRNAVKKVFLLILDLNGVLVARRSKGSFIHRPYAKEFIDFAFKNFAVGVWTSGLQRTCEPIIESVMGEYKHRLLFVFFRDKCELTPTPDNKYGTKKHLKYIFSMFPDSFHSVNTIIIDDSPEKCSHPDIALCPAPFNKPSQQKDDEGLKEVISVLKEVLEINSHFPLIRAAERRLSRLADIEGAACPELTNIPSASSSLLKKYDNQDKENASSHCLCCYFITQGKCKFGASCHYRHVPDDGVSPCSQRAACLKGHAHR